jgi:hypothetical protein
MKGICVINIGIGLLCGCAMVFAQIPIQISGTPPSSINNSTATWFPPIVDQGARESCGNATGIGYIFNYEINAARNLSAKETANQYPYFHTYDFLNGGDETADPNHDYYRHFLAAWKIVRENGIPKVTDFGTADLNSTRWLSGYDKYHRAMVNRVDKIDSFAIADTSGLRKMKQWLKDHGNGSSTGGIFAFTAYIYGNQEVLIPSGAESGKYYVKAWGNDPASGHCMAIVGYNDSVHYDFNGDGKFTNNIDLSNDAGVIKTTDGKITMADWEVGAFMVANSWGSAVWDNGISYAPYRSLFISPANGGILSGNRIYYLTVKNVYTPRLALKISITNTIRNAIALSVGVSVDPQATVPTVVRRFDRQFTYSGGAFPMCGKGASPSIEIGVDISDLLDSIPALSAGTFFLVVDSKGVTGTVDSLSLMDYTSGTLKQKKSAQTVVPINPGSATVPARTYIGVSTTLADVLNAPRTMGRDGYILHRSNGKRRLRLPLGGKSRISLYDLQGKQRFLMLSGAADRWIDLSPSLPVGSYILAILSDKGGSLVRRVNVVQ